MKLDNLNLSIVSSFYTILGAAIGSMPNYDNSSYEAQLARLEWARLKLEKLVAKNLSDGEGEADKRRLVEDVLLLALKIVRGEENPNELRKDQP